MTKDDLAIMYRRVLRSPNEGTMTAAIDAHAQACGLVSYVAGVHPDEVARAVGDAGRSDLKDAASGHPTVDEIMAGASMPMGIENTLRWVAAKEDET